MRPSKLADEGGYRRYGGDLMEMTRLGKPWKTKSRFSQRGFPTRLEIALAIPTFPQVRRQFSFTQPAEAEAEADPPAPCPAQADVQ